MQEYCRALLPGAHGSREITEHLSADGADPEAGAVSSHMREEQSEQGSLFPWISMGHAHTNSSTQTQQQGSASKPQGTAAQLIYNNSSI